MYLLSFLDNPSVVGCFAAFFNIYYYTWFSKNYNSTDNICQSDIRNIFVDLGNLKIIFGWNRVTLARKTRKTRTKELEGTEKLMFLTITMMKI
ncbi:hypothetical protein BVG16_27670 [Paenibacillus selenitireducens]|uniref:Uncharacterized protein n=1 Tax=Paenibacillus selenitireducens TaxID=1324314 RepID=A0A1T2X164_9BACL|nr:hypothetical protein BVG16_27670 [Paenibacillus selenitireducens]